MRLPAEGERDLLQRGCWVCPGGILGLGSHMSKGRLMEVWANVPWDSCGDLPTQCHCR